MLDTAVAVAILDDPVELVDPATLEPRTTSTEKSGDGIAAGSPDLWVSTSDGAVATVDAAGATIAKIPGISGSLTTAPGAVWVLDDDAVGAIRLRAG